MNHVKTAQAILAIIFVGILFILLPLLFNQPTLLSTGTVICPEEQFVGSIKRHEDDVYIIYTESGEVRAPKSLCILKLDP